MLVCLRACLRLVIQTCQCHRRLLGMAKKHFMHFIATIRNLFCNLTRDAMRCDASAELEARPKGPKAPGNGGSTRLNCNKLHNKWQLKTPAMQIKTKSANMHCSNCGQSCCRHCYCLCTRLLCTNTLGKSF